MNVISIGIIQCIFCCSPLCLLMLAAVWVISQMSASKAGARSCKTCSNIFIYITLLLSIAFFLVFIIFWNGMLIPKTLIKLLSDVLA